MTVADLSRVLLDSAALVALADAPTIARDADDWTGPSNSAKDVDDPACASLLAAGDTSLYHNSGYVSMRRNNYDTPPSTPYAGQVSLSQSASYFLDSDDASAFLQRAQRDWQQCANRSIAVTFIGGDRGHLDTDALQPGDQRIELSMAHHEDPRWRCAHALAVRNTVAVESRICMADRQPAPVVADALTQMLAAL